MKKSLSIILSLLMILSSVTVFPFAAGATPASGKCGENVSYVFDSAAGTLTISGTGNMYEDYLSAPDDEGEGGEVSPFYYNEKIKTIVIGSGVTSVGRAMFVGCTALTSVTIPDTVTKISANAFESCKSLKTAQIPYGVDSIYFGAFRNCTGLTSVTIPDSVTSIGAMAFANCKSLPSVTIPASVTSLPDDDNIFSECSSLASIKVDSANTAYDSRNNCNAIIRKDGNILLSGCKNTVIPNTVNGLGENSFYGTSIAKVVIPNSVTIFGIGAFSECEKLTSATLGANVKSIPDRAFCGCTALKSVKLNKGLKTIGNSAFSFCSALASIAIPYGVTDIDDFAFHGCKSIKSLTIPNTVKNICWEAFSDCKALASVKLGLRVEFIGIQAFANCKALTSIAIPSSVTYVGEYAFENCSKLAKITVGSKNKYYDSRNKCNAIIKKKGTVLVEGCKNTVIPKGVKKIGRGAFLGDYLKKVTIPNTVKTIEYFAFSGTRLRTVTIPNSVTVISPEAFNGCKDLYYVKLSNKLEFVDDNTFANCPSLQNVVIPTGVKRIAVSAFSKNNKGTTAGLNGISFWYCGTKTKWKSVTFLRVIANTDDDDYYRTASQSWIDAYTKRTHFNYKNHTHKMKTKYSKYPTFKAEGKKSCTCTKCKMKFKNIPASKLVSPSVKKVTRGKKAFTVTWKKAPTVAGYQIQYARNAKFKKAKKITVKKAGSTKKTVKKLASGKKYYVRVRAYKKIGGKKVYSKWSAAKTVKTK